MFVNGIRLVIRLSATPPFVPAAGEGELDWDEASGESDDFTYRDGDDEGVGSSEFVVDSDVERYLLFPFGLSAMWM